MGNTHSIEALLEHSQWVRGLARALVGSGDADDLVQDTYAVALGRPEVKSAPRAWLGTVARQLAQNRRRTKRHRRDRETLAAAERSDSAAGSLSPAAVVERSEVQRAVVDAEHSLSEPYRDVILLCYFDGLTPVEIAEVRALKPETVRTQLARGRAAVREALDARSDGDRREWVLALTPLLKARRVASVASAGSTVSAFAFWKIAAVVIAVSASVAWWNLSRLEGPPTPGSELPLVAAVEQDEEAQSAPAGISMAALAPNATRSEVVVVDEPPVALEEGFGTLLVLDGRTKQPIPNYRVEFVMETEEATESRRRPKSSIGGGVETDREGRAAIPLTVTRVAPVKRFQTSTHVRKLLGTGGTSYDDSISVMWTDGAATIETPSYATVPLKLNLPSGVLAADLFGRVITKSGWLSGALESEIREGHVGPFLRFADRFAAHANDLEVCLVSADGRHFAIVPYASYRMGERTWDVEWRQHGSVRLRVQRDGKPVTNWPNGIELWPGAMHLDASGQVLPADGRAGEPRPERRFLRRTVERGVFELTAIQPGTYTVTLHDRFAIPWSRIIEIEPGEVLDIDVELVPSSDEMGPVRGIVTSASGSFNGPMLAYATDLRPQRWRETPTSAKVIWANVDGRQVGTFELKDVVLDAHSVGFYRSSNVRTRTPMGDLLSKERYGVARGETLEIHLEDGRPEVTVKVKARDAVTMEPIDWFQLDAIRLEDTARGLPAQFIHANSEQGIATLEALTAPEAFGLLVNAHGYQQVLLKPGVLKDRSELTVELQPGWSAALGAMTSTGEVLEGVEFFVGGVSVGEQLVTSDTTNVWSDSHLYGSMPILRLEAAPTRIEARKEGWSLSENSPTDEQWRLTSHAAARGAQLIWRLEKSPAE